MDQLLTLVLIAAAFAGIIGLVLGGIIGFAAKKFAVETDPNIELVQELLPGANCGGCGYAGCADMAQAIVLDGVEPSVCPVCPPENRNKISEALGRAMSEAEKKVAIVFCGGSFSKAKHKAFYNGVKDCRSASIISGGGKACRFGCLGLGTCANTCPFGAIEMRDGLALIHPDLCVGCGKCESVCPRKLIRMVSENATVQVFCNSLDKAPVRRKNCSVPCISCRKCVKVDEEHMQIQNLMVRANPSNPPDESIIERAGCPTGCLQTNAAHCQTAGLEKENKAS